MSSERKLIIQDFEPDDATAIAYQHMMTPSEVPFFILVSSPDPEKHTRETQALLETLLKKKERNISLEVGPKYGRGLEDDGFELLKDPPFSYKMDRFISEAEDDSVTVYLLTSCYCLVKWWHDDWLKKIKVVFQMGGEGVPTKDENGKETTQFGFNWRCGSSYIAPFLKKVPYNKRFFLETRVYNEFFKNKFNIPCKYTVRENGKELTKEVTESIVSLCPLTFPKFTGSLNVLCYGVSGYIKKDEEVVSFLIKKNLDWIKSAWGKYWESEEVMKRFNKFYPTDNWCYWFGPADILLSVMSLEKFETRKKKIFVPVKKENGDFKFEYEIASMEIMDCEFLDEKLAEFVKMLK